MEKTSPMRRAAESWRFWRTRAGSVCVLLAAILLSWPLVATAQTIQVDATPSHVVNVFSPPYALGSTVDRVPSNATDPFFKRKQLRRSCRQDGERLAIGKIQIYLCRRGIGTQREAGAMRQGRATSLAMPIRR